MTIVYCVICNVENSGTVQRVTEIFSTREKANAWKETLVREYCIPPDFVKILEYRLDLPGSANLYCECAKIYSRKSSQ